MTSSVSKRNDRGIDRRDRNNNNQAKTKIENNNNVMQGGQGG